MATLLGIVCPSGGSWEIKPPLMVRLIMQANKNGCRSRAVVFEGDSHFTRLDAHILHKDKVRILNISKGGSKLCDVEKALGDFYINHSHELHVEKILLSIGTNNICYCQDHRPEPCFVPSGSMKT